MGQAETQVRCYTPEEYFALEARNELPPLRVLPNAEEGGISPLESSQG